MSGDLEATYSLPKPSDAGEKRHFFWCFAIVLGVGAAVRAALIVPNGLGLLDDTDFFLRWTRALHEQGLENFYTSGRFCDYPPFFVLLMWAIGRIAAVWDAALSSDHLLRVLLKIPACLADLAIAVTLLLEGRRMLNPRLAVAAAALFLLNPVAIYNSAYWGQVDSIHTALLVLALAMVGRGRWLWAGAFCGLALSQKFQSIALVPLFVFEAWRLQRWRGLGRLLIGAALLAGAVLLPFAARGVADDVLQRAYVNVVGQYHKLSPSAFNIWHLLGSPDVSDTSVPRAVALVAAGGADHVSRASSPLLWLTWRHISLCLYAVVVAIILSVYSLRGGRIARWTAAAALGLAFFLTPTEMHERYAHPAIAFLALWAASGAWRERIYVMISVLLLLNMTYILPAGGIAPHIGFALVGMLVAIIAAERFGSSIAQDRVLGDAIASEPPEAGNPSVVIAWFRRATVVAVCILVLAAGLIVWQGQRCAAIAMDKARYLSALRPISMEQSWGKIRWNRSVIGSVMQLGEEIYLFGLGTHAASTITYDIPPGCTRFKCVVGIDAETRGKGNAVANVALDGRTVYTSPFLTGSGEPAEVDIPLEGARRITLRVAPSSDGNQSDHVDWALARFE